MERRKEKIKIVGIALRSAKFPISSATARASAPLGHKLACRAYRVRARAKACLRPAALPAPPQCGGAPCGRGPVRPPHAPLAECSSSRGAEVIRRREKSISLPQLWRVDYITPQPMKRSISPLDFSKPVKLPPKSVLKNHSKS